MSQQTQEIKFVNKNASNLEFIRPANLEAGATITGVYAGAVPNRFEETKMDYKIEETDAAGNATGKTVVVNGAGNLASRMSAISVGQLIQIKYLGRQKIAKGKMAGKEAHNFEVLTAE